jgi:Sulfatase
MSANDPKRICARLAYRHARRGFRNRAGQKLGDAIIAPVVHVEFWNPETAMADEAIQYIKQLKEIAPGKPWFVYYVPGATHAPHHPTPEWVKKISDMHLFDEGWNKVREKIFANQKRLGIMPENAKLTPWPEGLLQWDSLSWEEKKLFIKQADVYGAYLAYADHEIGVEEVLHLFELLRHLGSQIVELGGILLNVVGRCRGHDRYPRRALRRLWPVSQQGEFGVGRGKVVFLYNLLDLKRTAWEGPELTAGKHTIVFDFKPDGPGLGKGGTGVLSVDGKEVAKNSMEHTTPITFPEDESFDIGQDTRTGVALLEYRYDVPFKFTGKINKLTFKLEPEKEMAKQ